MEHVDVLIVGAGLSGVGAAWHLQHRLPGRRYAILEAREELGGTWSLFRYPGIRSDSDLATFAYAFKPWTGEKAIADGSAILDYIRQTAGEAGIDRHIRFGHRVLRASWSSRDARWTVEAERLATGERVVLTASWLFGASGYYSYDGGFSPGFPGEEAFGGELVHPHRWPEDLDVAGRRVVVIGSGATAVTLVPALVERGAHVTMLQRSPSYVIAVPARDALADRLRAWFGDVRGHELTRRKNILQQQQLYALCQRHPRSARWLLKRLAARQLGDRVGVEPHFDPRYDPWDQRLCVVPDGDLFAVLRRGEAEIVTDAIDTFTPRGVRTRSGRELDADVVVTATGLNLLLFGGMELEVDGTVVTPSERLTYKGMMLSDVPNFAFALGYTNASWTLKVDLVCEHLCRLLAHADLASVVEVRPVADDPEIRRRPLLDFQAGYVLRALDALPSQGDRGPWQLSMRYRADVRELRHGPVTDPALRMRRAGEEPAAAEAAVTAAA